MHKAALLKSDVVTNTAKFPNEALPQGWILCPDEVSKEWTYQKGTFSPPKVAPPVRNAAQAMALIDERAAAVIARWSRFAEEYKEREFAAMAYKAANYTGDISVYISSFADPAGIDYTAATDLILKQASKLRLLQEQLAVERMRKYELQQPDLSIEQISALSHDIITNIDMLGTSYE